MPDSKQLAILKTLTTQIEVVNPDNGYAFDLRGKVFRGRTVFGSEVVLPFVSILEAPRPPEDLPVGETLLQRQTDWQLLVQGWAPEDKTHPLDSAYALKASVEQVLSQLAAKNKHGLPVFPDSYLLGRRAISVTIGPGVCRPPSEAASVAFFYLPVLIVYPEDLIQPFDE